MELAHSAGGASIEVLTLAGLLLVVGVVLAIQKSVKPLVGLGVIALALALGFGAFAFDGGSNSGAGGSGDVTVSIASPSDGTTVAAGTPVVFQVDLAGAELSGAGGGAEGGHLHVFVDGELDSMPSDAAPSVELELGTHIVTIEYVGANHGSFDPPITDEVTLVAE